MSNALLLWVAVLALAIIPNVRNMVLNEVELNGGSRPPAEQERIVNGQVASQGKFSYAAALHFLGIFICTASIISEHTVLTAAHCVVLGGELQPAEFFSAIIGNVSRLATKTNITFSKVTVHGDYNSDTLANDIAFLTTSLPISFNKDVSPICVASPWKGINLHKVDIIGTALGWGQTTSEENGTSAEYLHYTDLLIVQHDYCKFLYKDAITDRQLCAQLKTRGICYGDSGGPFVHKRLPGKHVLIGIASAVSAGGCGSGKKLPDVFTRMTSYYEWLMRASNDRNICPAFLK